MNSRRFLLLLILVVLSRLPFLWNGYGSDADAWRVAATAHHLSETGEYRASRLPGFPLYEILATPFVVLGGAPLSNASSIVAMLLVLVVWRRILRSESHHASLLLICLALTPILWKNSTTTMDYLWSLLFILLAMDRVMPGKEPAGSRGPVLWGGVLMGIAVGFRPTNAVMALPVIALLLVQRAGFTRIAIFALAAATTTLIAYLPPLLTYGPLNWVTLTRNATVDLRFTLMERALYFGYRSVYLLGPLAVLAALGIVLMSRGRIAHLLSSRDPLFVTSLAGVAAALVFYAAFPLEREYLIPLVPFLYLLLARVASRTQMMVFTLSVLTLAVVTPDVIRHHGIKGSPGLNIHGGVLQDYVEKRNLIMERRTALGNLAVTGPGVVMTGTGPEIWVENALFAADTAQFWRRFPEVVVHQTRNPDVHFIDALTREEIARVRNAGYQVYCFAPARSYLESILRYNMGAEGVTPVGEL